MIRIVQVGMGGAGLVWARDHVSRVEGAELVGCVDRDVRALERAQAQAPIPAGCCFTSLSAALETLDPDAVLITADTAAHVPLALEALEAGKHVLMEKPFAPSLEEAHCAVEVARSRGLVLTINQNYRYFPAVQLVSRLIRDQAVGEPGCINLDFRRYTIAPNGRQIRHYSLTQPLLLDMAIHHFDLMRYILSREATSLTCHSWNPPWSPYKDPASAVATIEFEGGAVVSYRGSWVSPGPITPWAGEWRMECSHGEITWTSRSDLRTESADRVSVRPLGEAVRELSLPEVKYEDRAGALAEFIKAVSTGIEAQSSGQDNLNSLAMAFAAIEAARTAQPVRPSAAFSADWL